MGFGRLVFCAFHGLLIMFCVPGPLEMENGEKPHIYVFALPEQVVEQWGTHLLLEHFKSCF